MELNTQLLRKLGPKALRQHLDAGFDIDPHELDDTQYRGISLGLPHWVERLTWTTFVKTFHRDPNTKRLRGWNVKLNQTGLTGPIEPLLRSGGAPHTFGHFEVTSNRPGTYRAGRNGLLIDYGLGGNGSMNPLRLLKDPIVALERGSTERLLGWTYVDIGLAVPTPSYFLLQRVGALDHVAPQ
jgi:hypothetical protein